MALRSLILLFFLLLNILAIFTSMFMILSFGTLPMIAHSFVSGYIIIGLFKIITDVLFFLLFLSFDVLSLVLLDMFTDSMSDPDATHINVMSKCATKYNYLKLLLNTRIPFNNQYASFNDFINRVFGS